MTGVFNGSVALLLTISTFSSGSETIFEVGVTNRPGGHGIGLSTIRNTLERDMNGTISFLGNNINKLKGATFRIILQ